MIHAVISDVHANDEALRRVLDDARRAGAGDFVCLGDVVGYGPQPREALRRVRETCSLVLVGNHDAAVAGTLDARDFIDLAGEAVSRHRDMLSPDDRAWLAGLPYTGTFAGARAAHGDFTEPERFLYVDEPEGAGFNFAATGEALLFTGHTHTPGIFIVGASGTVHTLAPQDFVLEPGKRYLVNPGSVGYPRESNGTCLSSYVLYDDAAQAVFFRFLPFAVSSVMQRGCAPRRHAPAWRAVCAFGILGALAAGTWLATRNRAEPKPADAFRPPPFAPAAAPVVRSARLALPASARHVRANLRLETGSRPAVLETVFRTTDGRVLCAFTNDVMKSCAKRMRVPADATSVLFNVRPAIADDRPVIASFEPGF